MYYFTYPSKRSGTCKKLSQTALSQSLLNFSQCAITNISRLNLAEGFAFKIIHVVVRGHISSMDSGWIFPFLII